MVAVWGVNLDDLDGHDGLDDFDGHDGLDGLDDFDGHNGLDGLDEKPQALIERGNAAENSRVNFSSYHSYELRIVYPFCIR